MGQAQGEEMRGKGGQSQDISLKRQYGRFPVSQMARWKNEVGEEDFKMILIGLRQYDIFKASCHVRFLRLFYQEFGVTNESPE